MASSMAASGPPPGLEAPAGQGMRQPSTTPYSRRVLLGLSQSPLVAPPLDMPDLKAWYGDWEPYTPRSNNQGGSHNYGAGAAGSMGGSGAGGRGGALDAPPHLRGERNSRQRGEEGGESNGEPRSENAGGLPGFQGVRKGAERGSGFRRFEERTSASNDDANRNNNNNNSRFPPSGKNPFGQISASGTFRPAGKDGSNLESPTDKRFGGMRREGSASTGLDERPRGLRGSSFRGEGRDGDRSSSARDFGGLRDKRRPAPLGSVEGGAADDGEEWESVPRSPETERRMRAQREADAASDWRRGGNSSSAPRSATTRSGSGLAGRDSKTDPRRTAFPSWMADEAEPSWMTDEPAQATAPSKTAFNAFSSPRKGDSGGANDEDAQGASGMDSIQAFKAQMKERERLERARSGTPGTIDALKAPPGLERRAAAGEESERASGERNAGGVGGGIFDNFTRNASGAAAAAPEASNNRTASEEPAVTSPTTSAHLSESAGGGAGGAEPPGLPGRSSRFARFFDGKPRDPHAAALAAQQKYAELQSPTSANAPEGEAGATPRAGQSLTINELFGGMSVAGQAQGQQQQESVKSPLPRSPGPPPVPPPGLQQARAAAEASSQQQKHAEADQQQQQKPVAGQSLSVADLFKGLGLPPQQQHVQAQQQPHTPTSQGPPLSPAIQQQHQHQQQQVQQQQHRPPPAQQQQQQHQQGPPTHSPSMQQQAGFGYGAPPSPHEQFTFPPGGLPAGFPGGRPPFAMDPRMLGRPGGPPQGLPPGYPPHLAAALNGMPTRGGVPPGMGFPPPPGSMYPGNAGGMPPRGPPPPGMGLPPHIQQQLMSMPPHMQHQFLTQHFGGGGGGGSPSGQPPPPGAMSPHHQPQGSFGGAPGPYGSPNAPLPPPLTAANVMAMLGQRPGGA